MKKDIIDILCCLTCKSEFNLTIEKENDNNEIIEGKLICKNCGEYYYIRDGIPEILPKKQK